MSRLDRFLRKRELNRWIFSLITVVLLLSALFAYSDLTYETNDDCTIVSVTAGYLTGEPNPVTVSTAYGYGALLAALYRLSAAVPWHALILLWLNAVSLTAVLHCCLSLCSERNISATVGVAVFLALFLGVLLPFTAQLQFTAVSGFAFTAALLLLVSLPEGGVMRSRRFRLILSALLLLFSFGIRPNVALMLSPLAVLLALGCWLRRVPYRRLIAFFTAGLLLAFGGLSLLDSALYARQEGWADFAAFDEQTTRLLDFNAQTLTPENGRAAIKAADWSDGLYQMVRNWYFLDNRVTADSLARLNNALQSEAAVKSAVSVLKATASIAKRYPMFQWNLLGWGLAALMAVVACLKRGNRWLAAQIIAQLAYAALLIAYFYGFRDRFPLRLAFCVACPTYALLLPSLADALDGNLAGVQNDRSHAAKRLAAAALAVALAGSGLGFAQHSTDGLSPRNLPSVSRRNAALTDTVNAYVSQHPENVYVTDYCQNFSPLTVYTPGAMKNLIYWGSGISRSPAAIAQLRSLGYEALNANHFFESRVLLLLVGGNSARSSLENYLRADYGLSALEPIERRDDFCVYRAIRTPGP